MKGNEIGGVCNMMNKNRDACKISVEKSEGKWLLWSR